LRQLPTGFTDLFARPPAVPGKSNLIRLDPQRTALACSSNFWAIRGYSSTRCLLRPPDYFPAGSAFRFRFAGMHASLHSGIELF
jgi:hypothetical protein